MKRALRIIETVLAVAFLAALLAVAVAVGTGALTTERLDLARRAMRGELVEPSGTTPGQTEEPKDLASRYADEALKEKQAALEELKRQEAMLAVQVNERRAELGRLENEAARVRKDVADRVEAVTRAEKAFAEAKAAQEKLVKGAGFRKQVETLENMKASDAARHLYGFEDAPAVELLRAFEPDFRAKVFVEIDRLDRAPQNVARQPRAATLLKMLWPGDAALSTPARRGDAQ